MKEGSLEAPDRQPLDWKNPEFYDKDSLYAELERVYDICHGCRRCVSLCDSFPTLFDLVDESDTFEVDGVDKDDYMKVVDQCYLCDLCAETKCPYLPPHEWAVDFPHLMLRAKAYKFAEQDTKWRDRLITSTDPIFDTISLPGIAGIANAAAGNTALRKLGDKVGIHPNAPLPEFHSNTTSRRHPDEIGASLTPTPCERTTGKVAIYITCYGDHNEPQVVDDMIAVFNHNGIPVRLLKDAKCCGMPKLELGDLKKGREPEGCQSADLPRSHRGRLRHHRPHSLLCAHVQAGAAAHVPGRRGRGEGEGGVLRSLRVPDAAAQSGPGADGLQSQPRQSRLPRGLPPAGAEHRHEDAGIPAADRRHRSDRHRALFRSRRHLRGEERDLREGHEDCPAGGNRVKQAEPDTFGSDCPMAGRLIAHSLEGDWEDNPEAQSEHPLTMVRRAYGI